MQNPQLLIETIIRTRIYECTYWKEQCFALSAEFLIDRAVKLNHIGGVSGNINPSDFLCLVMKLINLQPDTDVILLLIAQPHFKYLRALGAFYYRLTAKPKDIYTRLEPLLSDKRKLRMRKKDAFVLTFMDELIDQLLTEERYMDVILPRITQRFVLEDSGDLAVRESSLQDELDEIMMEETIESDAVDISVVEVKIPAVDEPVVHDEPLKKHSTKKVSKLFKKQTDATSMQQQPARTYEKKNDGDMSIEETNAMRASLGLKPLK